jgi:hypothetical protein
MRKVVICRDPLGFRLPHSFAQSLYDVSTTKYFEQFPEKLYYEFSDLAKQAFTFIKVEDRIMVLCTTIPGLREDPFLHHLVQTNQAEVPFLKVVEVPRDVEYDIVENDLGIEYIVEKHRIWY